MKAEILIIGDEILTGETLDTNSKYIARALNELGIEVNRVTAIADKPAEIKTALDELFSRSDLVISTGGLGPTSDDTTRKAIAEYYNCELVFNEEAYQNIQEIFSRRNRPINEPTRLQALVPSVAQAIKNPAGTAPALFIRRNGKILISLPGVPYEAERLIDLKVIPLLQEKLYNRNTVKHFNLMMYGTYESQLSLLLSDVEAIIPEGCKLSYLPALGIIKLRISVNRKDEKEADDIINMVKSAIEEKAGKYIFGYGNDTPVTSVTRLLEEKKLTIGTAESCTGGYLAHQITSIPGSSAYFMGSTITYSYELKENLLHVPHDILTEHGAVSEETVRYMAVNGQKILGVDCLIAISGIAGPSGGTNTKPVGMICVAIAIKDKLKVTTFYFGKNRMQNIQLTSDAAFDMLRKMLLEESTEC